MKLRLIFTAIFTLWVSGLSAQVTPPTTVGGRPVLWSVHFDAERLRTGAGKKLFADLDPILLPFSAENSPAGGKLESLAIFGFQPQKDGGNKFPLVADLGFSADGGGVSPRFEAISKKRGAPVESIDGHPAIHFQHQGREVWIAKINETRVLVSTSRDFLELALAAGADGPIASLPPRPDEILGGNVEIKPLLANNPALRDSELFKLLPHLDFHISSKGEQLDLDASAELDSERSARRAARMIDGMVAALAMRDASGVPWDDRLVLKQDGPRLAMQLYLEPEEAKKLLDSFARDIETHAKTAKDDE